MISFSKHLLLGAGIIGSSLPVIGQVKDVKKNDDRPNILFILSDDTPRNHGAFMEVY